MIRVQKGWCIRSLGTEAAKMNITAVSIFIYNSQYAMCRPWPLLHIIQTANEYPILISKTCSELCSEIFSLKWFSGDNMLVFVKRHCPSTEYTTSISKRFAHFWEGLFLNWNPILNWTRIKESETLVWPVAIFTCEQRRRKNVLLSCKSAWK